MNEPAAWLAFIVLAPVSQPASKPTGESVSLIVAFPQHISVCADNSSMQAFSYIQARLRPIDDRHAPLHARTSGITLSTNLFALDNKVHHTTTGIHKD